ncbi:hypothetical protein PVAP13_4KG236505 [Panicum virgatum]|uniref:Uncharacterized protein n=1 Tax=Panicum virgatum TaxID=38727 RepID=A0A8T0TVY2_PANVG|nr:hypothetical protein PVAP13_4KG236505 [Panicum virgatum]
MREPASPLWNKVLQTSLSFAGVCSGAGVWSASLPCTGVHRRPVSVVVSVLLSLSLMGSPFGPFVLLARWTAAIGREEARGCSRSGWLRMVACRCGVLCCERMSISSQF